MTTEHKLTEAQQKLMNKEGRIHPRNPERGLVHEVWGRQIRTAQKLEEMGLVEMFTIAPYDNWFYRKLK